MRKNLLWDRRFWPLFWTQFLGAFNDNAFKNAMIVLITFQTSTWGGLSTKQMVALCGGIFIFPFFLFSGSAGQLADKVSKSRLVVAIKIFEIAVMVVGAVGFLQGSLALLLSALFLMGLHSTFFGPVKYSILPQLLHEKELLSANAYVEMGTFLAILLGTILGSVLITISGLGPWLMGGAMLLVSAMGFLTSRQIEPLSPISGNLNLQPNPIAPTMQMLRLIGKERSVLLSILGISWFWFFGAAVLAILPVYCRDFLHGDECLLTLFLTLFSVGIGVGSLLCGRLSANKLELGLVPLGSLGISLFALDLFFLGYPAGLPSTPQEMLTVRALLASFWGWRLMADLLLVAVFGGLFIVPLYTFIQHKSSAEERSRIIAGNNIVNALFMVLASVLLMVLFALGTSIPRLFLLLSLGNLVVAIYIYTVVPEFLLRLVCAILVRILYRLRVVGREHLPSSGPAVLVCNHVSFIDWLVISGASPRPIRFVMHHSFLQLPLTKRFFRDAGVIPIAGSLEDSKILATAFTRIAEALANGDLVCIFPEGRLTTDGSLRDFRPGIEKIVARSPVSVVPMALRGMWGSFFSKKHGKPMRRPFRRIWSRITLVIGPAVPPETVSAASLHKMVGRLLGRSEEPGASCDRTGRLAHPIAEHPEQPVQLPDPLLESGS
ncbi:MAG TPA: glycerol acyltransferase [Syntrophobacteraceae bacterium]|nr:glycerol acyltransferase [Syntrophobacteraceae bacterium]